MQKSIPIMSFFIKAMEIASNPTVPVVQSPVRKQFLEETTAEKTLPAPSSSLISPLWAGGELSSDTTQPYNTLDANTSKLSLSEDDSFVDVTLGPRPLGTSQQPEFEEESDEEEQHDQSLFGNSDSEDEDFLFHKTDPVMWESSEDDDVDMYPEDLDNEQERDEQPYYRYFDTSLKSDDMPSPTESQLIKDNFKFHRDMSEEERDAIKLDRAVLWEALRDAAPELTRKEQWHAYKEALQHGSTLQNAFGDLRKPRADLQSVQEASPVSPKNLSSLWSEARNTGIPYSKEENIALAAEQEETGPFEPEDNLETPMNTPRSEEGLGIKPIKLGPNGNPFAGNARSKYIAITGYDLVDLAARWEDGSRPIDQRLKNIIERRVNSKRQQFWLAGCVRDRLSNYDSDSERLKKMNPAAQFMYLQWPGAIPVAREAMEEYRQYVEADSNDDLGNGSPEMWSYLEGLSSEEQLDRLRLEEDFWNDFSFRMGLEDPEVYANGVDPDCMNEAGQDLYEGDFSDKPALYVHPNSYVGPILYPSFGAGSELNREWARWHGPSIDKERVRRETIEAIEGSDFNNYVGRDVLKEQTSYLSGLTASQVEQYLTEWYDHYNYFEENEQQIYERWGEPLGRKHFTDWQQTMTEQDNRKPKPQENDSLMASHCEGTNMLMTPADSPQSAAQPRIPGLGHFQDPTAQSAAPPEKGDERPNQHEARQSTGPLESEQRDQRRSTPAYSDTPPAPSPITSEREDEEMPDAPARIPQASSPNPISTTTTIKSSIRTPLRRHTMSRSHSPEKSIKIPKTPRSKSTKIEKRAPSTKKTNTGGAKGASRVRQAVERIEKIILQADGSPPRRSSRIRGKKEGGS